MKLKDILAISGKPGLYQFISQGRNGIIVESFDSKKRMAVNAATKVSSMEDIAIYTDTEELPLKDVFKLFYEKEGGKPTISHKVDNNELKAKFEEILPDYDKERVYISDIKKVINWYNILMEQNLFDPAKLEEEEKEEDSVDEKKDETKESDIK